MDSALRHGVAPLLGYAALTAALDVYAGNLFSTVDPTGVAAVAFTLSAVIFIGFTLVRTGPAELLARARAAPGDVLALNVTTAVTWLSMLYALKYLEPAIVNVVGLALGPVFAVVLGPLLRKGKPVLAAEAMVAAGIGGVIVVLGWASLTGRSGIGDISGEHALAGMALTVLCGLGVTTNVVFAKRLSDADLPAHTVLALRLPFTVVVTWTIVITSGARVEADSYLGGTLVGLLGLSVPIYLLQIGIRHTEPVTTSLLCTLSPVFALLIQLPDGRLTPSTLTIACVATITALVAAGTLSRARHERASITAPVALPDSVPQTAECCTAAPGTTPHRGTAAPPTARPARRSWARRA
ncbi:EamA-like transporter family protein [Herbihabitans rhizosphaerae]|uniref:EamA-like transporter family protein n=1 Tax=Herbihabitans rhizosphaerae TaxID=1872711 RepID=A0A4V2ES16_9PSEU|nr:EamA-like transporter family protein [Herbihabitans rhizosphaerae]